MSFISIDFIIFFIVVVTTYFILPFRLRWILLLAASYYFYMYWNVNYIYLIVFSTLVDYIVAILIDRVSPERKSARRSLLTISLLTNLGVLFIFKYFNFFSLSAAEIMERQGLFYQPITLGFLLPVGISFYTFQSMAYTIDVYRGKLQPEKHLGIFATYISFFPQLVAGPIERAPHLLPQFHRKYDFDADRIAEGLRQMLWGAFKKVVIADRLSIYVNHVYTAPELFNGPTLTMATVFFAFQIYCDFSAYSDIAIGAAKVLGFDLMQNFRQPYFALSIQDFWRRWHISLSTWFRDYLYFPLGGSRVSLPRNMVNLFIVFLVSGLWHGAAWTFVVWGAIHGIVIAVETLAKRADVRLVPDNVFGNIMRLAYTFVIVCVAWVFFRANSIGDAFYIVTHFFDFTGDLNPLTAYQTDYMSAQWEFLVSILLIGVLLITDYLDMNRDILRRWGEMPFPVRWGVYYSAIAAVFLSHVLYGIEIGPQFIYFQF